MPNRNVATEAQEAAYLSCGVVVIDRKTLLCGLLMANGATATLSKHHLIILSERDPKRLLVI